MTEDQLRMGIRICNRVMLIAGAVVVISVMGLLGIWAWGVLR